MSWLSTAVSWLGFGLKGAPSPPRPHNFSVFSRPQKGGNRPGPKFGIGTEDRTPKSGLAWLDKHAWGIQAADQMMSRLSGLLDDTQPAFMHTISVTVQGGPQSDLRRVWYLALATAFGRLRNRVRSIQQTELDATWDVTGKACSLTIGYYHNGLIGAASRVGTKSGITNPLTLIQRGPDQVTVGGSWPTWLQATTAQSNGATGAIGVIGGAISDLRQALGVSGPNIRAITGITATNNPDRPGLILAPQWEPVYEIENGGPVPDVLLKFTQFFNSTRSVFVELPTLSGDSNTAFYPWSRVSPVGGSVLGALGSRVNTDSQLPTLPDDGRVITTGQKTDPRVQNPRPPVDGKSRASFVQLVAAALANPGILPDSPPGGFVPLAAPGLFVYTPGLGLEDERVNNGRFSLAVADVETVDSAPNSIGTLVPPIGLDGTTIDGYKVEQRIPNVRQP